MNASSSPVVYLTGATGNLGAAIVRSLLRQGARLVLPERAQDRLPKLFPELVGSPDHLLLGGVNLADEGSVAATVQAARERFGRIDGLVNTVVSWRGGGASHESPLADWSFLHEANVLPVLLTCRALAPIFLAQKSGRVVNISSRGGLHGDAGSAAYASAKAAVLRITETFSAELRESGVNVNSVLPSTIDTPQNRAAMPTADHSRWVAPDAIADVVTFLLSDGSRAIHGASIPVYGLA